MRIVGEVEHPKYKITIFKMNERISVKIEDRLMEQIYKFRDGSGVSSPDDIKSFLSDEFMADVDEHFSKMGSSYHKGLEEMQEDEELNFEII